MIVYAFVILTMVCLLFKERSCLGCGSILSGEDCNNEDGKAVVGTQAYISDTVDMLLEKIKYAGNYKSRFVTWRGVVLTSFLIIISLWFIVLRKMPSEWELITGMMVVFLGISMMNNFYKFHLFDHISKNIDLSTKFIKDKINSLKF